MYKYKSLQAGQLPQGYLSFLQDLLSQNIWNKKLMTTSAFAWMNVAPEAFLFMLLPPMEKCPMGFYQGVIFTAHIFYNSSPCD